MKNRAICVVSPDRDNIERLKADAVSEQQYGLPQNLEFYEGAYKEMDWLDMEIAGIREELRIIEADLDTLRHYGRTGICK